jgi:hypothetical protein
MVKQKGNTYMKNSAGTMEYQNAVLGTEALNATTYT